MLFLYFLLVSEVEKDQAGSEEPTYIPVQRENHQYDSRTPDSSCGWRHRLWQVYTGELK